MGGFQRSLYSHILPKNLLGDSFYSFKAANPDDKKAGRSGFFCRLSEFALLDQVGFNKLTYII